ncbi:MAG TPA: M23 family metallopeptidase [Desulfobacterales bacterium]|nr:M23 family metallopeptidase [Desulfobacterales bacterium]
MSHTGSPVKQGTVSKTFLLLLSFIFTTCLIISGFIAYDYANLKKSEFASNHMESRLSYQQAEINRQRVQIRKFADEINSLKSKLVNLNNFEKKIRIIANIEKAEDQGGLFGVGGSMPEDLDPGISLKENHSALMREMHDQVKQLNLASIKQEDSFESLLNYLKEQENLLASTPSIRPTEGWISSKFGYRESPFTGRREFHKGMDIANRKGTPIVASADGVVTYSGSKGFLGNLIVIDHGHGIVTRYAHADKLLKQQGEKVKRGDTIALMGNSGRSTGPHLHYEVRLNGISVNPSKYIMN